MPTTPVAATCWSLDNFARHVAVAGPVAYWPQRYKKSSMEIQGACDSNAEDLGLVPPSSVVWLVVEQVVKGRSRARLLGWGRLAGMSRPRSGLAHYDEQFSRVSAFVCDIRLVRTNVVLGTKLQHVCTELEAQVTAANRTHIFCQFDLGDQYLMTSYYKNVLLPNCTKRPLQQPPPQNQDSEAVQGDSKRARVCDASEEGELGYDPESPFYTTNPPLTYAPTLQLAGPVELPTANQGSRPPDLKLERSGLQQQHSTSLAAHLERSGLGQLGPSSHVAATTDDLRTRALLAEVLLRGLKEERDALQAERSAAQQQLQAAKAEAEEAQAKGVAAQKLLAEEATAHSLELTAERDSARAETEAAKARVESLRSLAQEQLQSMARELEAVKTERDSAVSGRNAALAERDSALAERESERKASQQALQAAKDSAVNELASRDIKLGLHAEAVKALRAELQSVKADLDRGVRRRESLEAELAAVNSKLRAAEASAGEAAAQQASKINAVKAELAAAEQKLRVAEGRSTRNHAGVQQNRDSAEAELRATRTELQAVKDKLRAAAGMSQSLKSLSKTVAEMLESAGPQLEALDGRLEVPAAGQGAGQWGVGQPGPPGHSAGASGGVQRLNPQQQMLKIEPATEADGAGSSGNALA